MADSLSIAIHYFASHVAGKLGSLALVGQAVWKKENDEMKTVMFYLKLTLWQILSVTVEFGEYMQWGSMSYLRRVMVNELCYQTIDNEFDFICHRYFCPSIPLN